MRRSLKTCPTRRRTSTLPHNAGVTLIELLIAVTLVALLATGMVVALRVGLSAMDKTNARMIANRRVTSVEKILETQVADMMPVQARCIQTGDNPAALVPFFQGDPQSMRFVSSYSLQQASRGMPMILEYQVAPGENGVGVRLLVNEHLYTGPLATGAFCAGLAPDITGMLMPVFVPVETGPGSFVLADKLAYCRFSYRLLTQQGSTVLEAWFPHWSKKFLPSAIRVDMAPLEPDGARVQLLPLTIPVHVTRDPMKTDYVY